MLPEDMSSLGQLPAYEPAMLVVKLRPEATEFAPTFATAAGDLPPTGGLSALNYMQKAGVIKEVTPVSGAPSGVVSPAGVAGALSTMMTTADGDDAAAGVGFIQMDQEQDLRYLQRVIGSDDHFEYANRVPTRWAQVVASDAGAGEPGSGETEGEATVAAVPPPAALMWNLRRIRWAEARDLPNFLDAEGIRVGVLDTGVDQKHPDLAGNVSGYTYNYDDLPVATSELDIVGHGTHVSGTIAARINNDVGINGMCSPALFVWKIFVDEPVYFPNLNYYTYKVDPVLYHKALGDCVGKTEVINLSIGGTAPASSFELALFEQLRQNDITVVAAMGNAREQGNPTMYPAAIPGVIAVGATSVTDRVASFSNAGAHISLCAPGVGIWSTMPTYTGQSGFYALRGPAGNPAPGMPDRRNRGTDYQDMRGTSMAAPHVTGAVALLLSKHVAAGNALSPDQVRMQLANTADKVPDMGDAEFSTDYGFGRLNLELLLS